MLRILWNHNGKLVGGASFIQDAKRGKVLKVDGVDGHAEVPHADDIIFTQTDSFTLSVWLNVLVLPGHWCYQEPRYKPLVWHLDRLQ
jgi:hypothetical protein